MIVLARTRTRRARGVVVGLSLMLAAASDVRAADDWDLYMLRLVNRARQNPAAEAGLIGSIVTDARAPVPPLAYQEQVGQAAINHNTWMHSNFGSIASGSAPDSFTHYETLNGASSGTPATGTPGYTGASLGTRITATGFSWTSAGENIATRWSSEAIPVDKARIDALHKGWWDSSGHRNNMLSSSYNVFGHRAESRAFVPPRGGLSAPFDNIHFATQTFARISGSPATYIFGLLFNDVDGNGTWTPRDLTHPQHEGRGGVAYSVYVSGTPTRVTGGTTMPNGGFSVRAGNGSYDIAFALGGSPVVIENVVVASVNVFAGDITSAGVIGGYDPETLVQCLGGPGQAPSPTSGVSAQECRNLFDDDGDNDVDLRDYAEFMRNY